VTHREATLALDVTDVFCDALVEIAKILMADSVDFHLNPDFFENELDTIAFLVGLLKIFVLLFNTLLYLLNIV
jgi:hypothetical protein